MKSKLIVGIIGLVLLITGFVAVPLIAGGSVDTSYSAFSEDTEWTGTSLARKSIENDETARYEVRTIGASPFVLRDVDADDTALVVVGMERPYTALEKDALDAFLEDGGSIIILDDEGYANEYTQRHGIKFLRQPILDASFDRNMSFIQVQATIGGEVFPVALNAPVALEDLDNETVEGPPLTVFMRSSDDSYLDLDSSGHVNVYDKEGPFNIGVRADFGSGGRLYVISDSGWLLNTMIEAQSGQSKGTNVEFLDALLRDVLPEGGMVLFDETRRSPASFELGVYATEKGVMSLFRSLPVVGAVFTVALLALAIVLLLQLPERENWVHRFRPGRTVKVEEETDLRHLLRRVLEVKVELDPASANDPAIKQALDDIRSVRDDDLQTLLRRVAKSMDLDVKFSDNQKSAPAAAPQGDQNPT